MPDDEFKDLHVRLERLEQQLETVGRKAAVTELTAADIEAFHKVQNAFWEDGTCGINETSPCVIRCNVWKGGKVIPRPKACIQECVCGPCAMGPGAIGGGFRFGGLGS